MEARGLCQATTQPYRLFDTPQITCPNIQDRIFKNFDFKIPKLGNSPNQFKSKSNEHGIAIRNSYLTIMKAVDIDVSSRTHI